MKSRNTLGPSFPRNIKVCELGNILLKNEIHHQLQTYQLVFERIFQNSIPSSKRDEYLLTEVCNIRSLISNSLKFDSECEIKMQVKNFKPKIQESTETTNNEINEKTLCFESKFESGNLGMAFKVNDNEYNLFMQNDINSQGHTQWFFFRITNTFQNHRVKFNLMNFNKPDSLYNYGMKLLVYSKKCKEFEDIDWQRSGDSFIYKCNRIYKMESNRKSLYTLTFYYNFKYEKDTVFFAYSYPYTYSDITDYMDKLEADEMKNKIITRKLMCRTLAGNKCEYLTITNNKSSEGKKCVVISARVHPGETVGSWMMQGIMEFLTTINNPEAEMLRKKFVFKLIPMLNPDGVINGNYRCSLAGCDLNRRWTKPNNVIYPTIYNAKRLIKLWHKEKGVAFFCDLHGHSRKKNAFMYGCNDPNDSIKTRVFPYMMSQVCPLFSFKDCKFGNQKSKERTSRITLFNELEIPNVFTLEASFCGTDFGKAAFTHYNQSDYMQIGHDLCKTLIKYFELDIKKDIIEISMNKDKDNQKNPNFQEKEKEKEKNLKEAIQIDDLGSKKFKEDEIKNKAISDLQNKKELVEQGNDSSSGSDDCPSEDNLKPTIIRHLLPNFGKRFKKTKPKEKEFLSNVFGLRFNKNKPEKKDINSEQKKPIKKQIQNDLIEKTKQSNTESLHRSFRKEKVRSFAPEEGPNESNEMRMNITYEDKATQTELIDFQKAKVKYLITKYGHSSNDSYMKKAFNSETKPSQKYIPENKNTSYSKELYKKNNSNLISQKAKNIFIDKFLSAQKSKYPNGAFIQNAFNFKNIKFK